jgi:hypothetical protein
MQIATVNAMGEHIIRRGQPTRPPQPKPRDRRSTAEIPQQQLHGLIHDPTHDDLEAELELVDRLPNVLPDSTPVSLQSASQRLAHTMRRGGYAKTPAHAVPVAPPVSLTEHTEVLAVPPPRAKVAARAARMMQAPPSAAPLLDDEALPSLFLVDPEPRLLTEIRTLPVEAPATEAPAADAAPIPRLLSAGRARLILPLGMLVLALGAAAFWLS